MSTATASTALATAHTAAHTDRRLAPRVTVRWPAKLIPAGRVRYVTGSTCNVSAEGLLVRLDTGDSGAGHDRVLRPGDRVSIALAAEPTAGVLAADKLIDATVVRTVAHDGARHVALRFAGAGAGAGVGVARRGAA